MLDIHNAKMKIINIFLGAVLPTRFCRKWTTIENLCTFRFPFKQMDFVSGSNILKAAPIRGCIKKVPSMAKMLSDCEGFFKTVTFSQIWDNETFPWRLINFPRNCIPTKNYESILDKFMVIAVCVCPCIQYLVKPILNLGAMLQHNGPWCLQ